jgi:hypothetical protein
MEIICDQAPDVVAIIAEIGEEPIHRRLEIGEGGEVLRVRFNVVGSTLTPPR